MPRYDYKCPAGHLFEQEAGYDDSKFPCQKKGCDLLAKREAVYEQYVTFKGDGFTTTVTPPPRPVPKSTRKENTKIDFEIKDQFAHDSYKYDENVRPYVKKKP